MKSRAILAILFVSRIVAVSAIEPDSLNVLTLNSFDMMKVFNPWLISTNPAGHFYNPDIYPGILHLDYLQEAGDYKRVQQGDQLNTYSFKTERYKRIKKTAFFGYFNYDKGFEEGTYYTDLNDPYRGTPYLLIDTIGNDIIDREFFSLRGDISTPVFRHLNWGFSAAMNVGLASQDRDPRPKNKVLKLNVSQGLILDYTWIKLGVNGLYSYYNEDIEIDIIRENEQLAFFQLHGFDTYTYHVAASFNRLYKRNTAGGEGQLNLKLGGLNTLFGAKLLYVDETADDGRKAGDASWSYIKNDSRLEGNELELFNSNVFRSKNIINTLNISWNSQSLIGAEIIQRLEQVGEAGAVDWVDYAVEEKYSSLVYEGALSYSFILMKDEYRKNFSLNLGVNYLGSEQAYYIPNMQDGYQNRIVFAGIDKSFYYKNHELKIGASLRSKKNISSVQEYNLESFISRKLLIPDFNYLTGNYKASGIDLGYALNLRKLFDKYYFNSSLMLYKGENDLKRIILNFSTGVFFKN